VVHAEAHGSGYEAHLLAPMIEAIQQSFAEPELAKDIFADVTVTADIGWVRKPRRGFKSGAHFSPTSGQPLYLR
jgi:hypothetical protein